ncbi:MAG: glycosyltransferase family 2 protein [Bacteriovoracaceae bacterium]|jgi:poly-beta-1,6-N-acetyl-D-glucosamine synthase|nr:glycosyltransferase family 2 protein [Bacteriovoracaceae bacterium]
MTLIFILSLLIIFMHYIGYPALLSMGAFGKKKHYKKKGHRPSVSYIVAAYNEEAVIEEKILNTLSLNYPKDKIEIIVVSDGSNDGTEKIAKSYETKGVKSLHSPLRRGKTAALNRAVANSSNEIIIFSDANSYFSDDSIIHLVENLHDSSIGGVCGRKDIVKNYAKRGASLGDHFFWSLESRLKKAQSDAYSITNADGEIFALRRELYPSISDDIINDDQVLTIETIKNDKRIIYETDAITYEEASVTLKDDYNVKRRMVCGAYQIIAQYPWIINPLNSKFSLHFFFHKFLRYTMFLYLFLFFISSAFLAFQNGAAIYQFAFYCQAFMYTLAAIGGISYLKGKRIKLLYIPYYYVLMNTAAASGLIQFLKKTSIGSLWIKADR